MKNKKLIIPFVLFFVFLSVAPRAFSFWIWSPKTKEWKNPKYSPLADPKLQLDAGLKLFEAKDYPGAIKEFKKILVHFPDAKEAVEARYYIGRSYEARGEPFAAFREYQKVVELYPQSSRIQEIVQREYDIGEQYLTHTKDTFLGFRVADFVDHPSLEIFKAVVENDPYSELAIKSQYKLGLLYKELRRYEEAIEAFEKVSANYPDSKWAEVAQFQIAHTKVLLSGGYQYDSSFREEAVKTYEEFSRKYPDLQLSQEAVADIARLNENEARKRFETAQFYEKQMNFKSALIYYEYVVSHFPESSWAAQSKERIRVMQEVVGGPHAR